MLDVHRFPSRLTRHRIVLLRTCAVMLCAALAAPTLAVDKVWNASWGDWSEANKWSPNGSPLAGDHAIVGSVAHDQPSLALDQIAAVAALTIAQHAVLDTEGRNMVVSGQTLIDGISDLGHPDFAALLRVENGPVANDFTTGTLWLAPGGALRLVGAGVVTNGVLNAQVETWIGGHGTINVAGNAMIGGELSVFGGQMNLNVAGANTIDLDGTAGQGEIIINDPNADLAILAGGVADPFDSYLFVGPGSDFTLAAPGGWSTGPDSLIQASTWASSGNTSRILGSPLNLGGRLVIVAGIPDPTVNALRLGAAATFQPTADVETNSSVLEVDNIATVLGGTFELGVDGEINFNNTATLSGGTFTLAQGADVSFNGPTAVSGGDFTTAGSYAVDGAIRFVGTTTWNAGIDVNGAARQIGPAVVTGPTIIHADSFDMDGGGAVVWDVNHSLVVNTGGIESGPGQLFDGVFNVTGGFLARLTINLDDPNDQWTMNGIMNLTGDAALYVTRVAGSPMRVTGDVTAVSGRSRVDAATSFTDSSSITFGAASAVLRFNDETQIANGASFSGAGTLQIGTPGAMTFESGASTGGALLSNLGRLSIADGPGVLAVHRFENAASGAWRVEIGGYIAGSEHDLLIVSPGQAQLAGTLDVHLVGGFEPLIGDEFVILTALGGINGTFANSSVGSCANGVRYQWTVVYGSNDVRVRLDAINTSYPGDLNCDCRVDFFDIDRLVEAFSFPGGAGWPHACSWLNGDCDGDGDVDFFDIDPFVALLGS